VPSPGPAFAVAMGSRCVAGKVVLTVSVRNQSEGPVSLVVSTPYGDKTIASLAAGGTATSGFTTRAAQIAAGTVTVTATAAAGAAAEQEVAFAAASCG
jgi:large repetitive protein